MLGSSNHTRLLDTPDSFGEKYTSESRVRREAFPNSTTVGIFAERTSSRAQQNVHALVVEFLTHGLSTKVGECLVPRRGDISTSREGGIEISYTETIIST
jgi:hypothetical protein